MHNVTPHIQLLTRRWNSWLASALALWLVLSLLGQAILPTYAYLRSESNPGLWNEICSSYGPRQIINQQDKQQAPSHHAECPLCLHIVSDVILATPQISAAFHLLLLAELDQPIDPHRLFTQRLLTATARGPPASN